MALVSWGGPRTHGPKLAKAQDFFRLQLEGKVAGLNKLIQFRFFLFSLFFFFSSLLLLLLFVLILVLFHQGIIYLGASTRAPRGTKFSWKLLWTNCPFHAKSGPNGPTREGTTL